MSLVVTKKIRGYLISSDTVTAIVPKSDIKVGWTKITDNFPCIVITQAGGTDQGYLGYKTSPAGSKIRVEESIFQIDIFSKNSRQETLEIADAVVKTLISGGCRKDSDIEMYDDDTKLYRKTQTYFYRKFHDD